MDDISSDAEIQQIAREVARLKRIFEGRNVTLIVGDVAASPAFGSTITEPVRFDWTLRRVQYFHRESTPAEQWSLADEEWRKRYDRARG